MLWLLDCVAHTFYTACSSLGREKRGLASYHKYLKKDKLFQMQIDFGITILIYAITKEWTDIKEPRS